MKKYLLAFLSLCFCTQSFSQIPYWQQEVNFTIDVSLNDKEHTLDGFEKIEYINNSPDTLTFIWFHLWPNAYKNDKTAYTDQALENGSTKFYFSNKDDKGYINRLDFKVNSTTAQTEDHPQHIDIIKLILPAPLPPGKRIQVTTPFHVKLPFNFSRGGHDGESYQVTQWFPKPAVYDRKGWHPMTYLDQGEFYSEFGSYEVTITVPKNYVVAATGELQNAEEKEWLKTRASYNWEPIKLKEKQKTGETKTITQLFPESSKELKTLQYKQNNIHDFAWFADKRFKVNYDTCLLASGRVIDVYTYFTPEHVQEWGKSLDYSKSGVLHYSGLVGEYPYNVVQVVQGPESFGGGMEYPTITIISPIKSARTLDKVITHEIGHNWFYGILGSNERDHPWLDEGINSYYDAKYDSLKYKKLPRFERTIFETKALTRTDQPIDLPAEKYSEMNYGLSVYYKTAEWLRYLESQIGTEAFNKAMQEYYRRWQFKHPQPKDFKQAIEESTGKNLDSIFAYTSKTGLLPNMHRKGTHFIFGVTGDAFMNGPDIQYKNQLVFSPYALGFNSYDKVMPGPFLTNYRMPMNRFQFVVAPMYAFGSKTVVGFGNMSYSFFPNGPFRKIDVSVSGSRFTMDRFKDSEGNKTFLAFYKIVPALKLILRQNNSRSNFYRYIQFKSFLIGEDQLRFYRDTIINGLDTSILDKYRTENETRTLNHLKLVIENNRALYPFRAELKAEQGQHFIRTAFTGTYFFNYPKKGGLNVRLFAGKFFYSSSKTTSKQFATDRYHLNMTGANGYEDYTYSDYFIGRNQFEGFASQQIMNRDGAFKIRTDLLADKVGRTDDWLIAANFSTTIPDNINPLNLLPFKIPVKLFFDIGTHAEAWKQGAETDRFLYDAGLQISFLKETVNIYFPLLYSSVYRDYYESTVAKNQRFWKRISFTIDISNFSFRKIDRNLEL